MRPWFKRGLEPRWRKRFLPELLTLGLLLFSCRVTSISEGLGWMVGFSLMLRCSWQGAMLLHGLGHSLGRALVDGQTSALNLVNILEHRSPGQVWAALWPLAPDSLAGSGLPWLAVGDRTPWKVRLKAAAGPLFNLLGLGLGFIGGVYCYQGDLAGARPPGGPGAGGLWLRPGQRGTADHQPV